jgi:uncharacterized protein (TIGR03437 family)
VYSTSGTVQAGEWISIYGNNLATRSAVWKGDFPTSSAVPASQSTVNLLISGL